MAIQTYRYRDRLYARDLNIRLSSVIVTNNIITPPKLIDIQADDTVKADLDEIMDAEGYEYAPTIQELFGVNVYRLLKNYNVGTWTCLLGSGNAVQANTSKQPLLQLSRSQQSYPQFKGSEVVAADNDLLVAPALATLPVYSATDTMVNFFEGSITSVNTITNLAVIIAINSGGGLTNGNCVFVANTDGPFKLYLNNAKTDFGINDGIKRRYIIVRDGATGISTIYVNNSAQVTTDAASAMGEFWKTDSLNLGLQPVSPDRSFNGTINCMGFMRFATGVQFTAAMRADLDKAIQNMTGTGTGS